MKPEEAIKSMNNIIEYWTYKPTEVEAAKMAIEALEKQIPKKPTLILDKSQNPPLYRCDCGMMSYYLEYEYCDECGQKLDWGKNEE